jgi:hypothetical protein
LRRRYAVIKFFNDRVYQARNQTLTKNLRRFILSASTLEWRDKSGFTHSPLCGKKIASSTERDLKGGFHQFIAQEGLLQPNSNPLCGDFNDATSGWNLFRR